MKVVVLLEAGIPSYRNFLFQYLNDQPNIDLVVLHTGRIYDHKQGTYRDKKVGFIGSNKLGIHKGIWHELRTADVIISSYNLRIITCWIPCFLFKNKWIFWGKGLGENDNVVINFLRKFTAKWSKLLLVYNQFKKKEIVEKLSINSEKVIAYQNTIRLDFSEDLGHEEKSHFLYFGRVQERKGLLELIREYSKYIHRKPESIINLRIVGNGEYKETLIQEVNKLGIQEYVNFFPGVYEELEIKEHFRNAAYYVSPYNVGLAIINSFSLGVPVLTCKSPQIGPEFHYLNNKNSVIVDSVLDFSELFWTYRSKMPLSSLEIYNYYNNNLHYSIMENNFVNAINIFKK